MNVVLDRYELEEMNENEEEGEEEEEDEISEMAESSFGGGSGDIRNPFAPEVGNAVSLVGFEGAKVTSPPTKDVSFSC